VKPQKPEFKPRGERVMRKSRIAKDSIEVSKPVSEPINNKVGE
jgi:hypothetical protein